MRDLAKKHAEKMRFALIGGINTAIDFLVLFILVGLGIPTLISNILSTSTALTFSFFANKKFTFKATNKITRSQVLQFLGITLTGLWIIQPVIIFTVTFTLSGLMLDPYVVLFIGKFIATIATLIWNYLLYKNFVFKKAPQ
jgi:putative flippase GtrA